VIPNNLLGLAVFAAGLGPGFVFVLVTERRRPRHDRSTLLEAAELVSVGAIASTISLLAIIVGADLTGWLDLDAAAADWEDYLLDEPWRLLLAFLAFILLGLGIGWALARLLTLGSSKSIEPGHSVWYQVFDKRGTSRVRVTAELRDGRRVNGFLLAYTISSPNPDERQIALHEPLWVQRPHDAEPLLIADRVLILQASDVRYLGVRFEGTAGKPVPLAEPAA
jgi:hypothetical protein